MRRVHFGRPRHTCYGGGGKGKTTGLDFRTFQSANDPPFVEVRPLNGSGGVATCYMQIPLNRIQEFIDALQEEVERYHGEGAVDKNAGEERWGSQQ